MPGSVPNSDSASGVLRLKTFKEVRFYLEANGFNEITQLGNHAKFINRTGESVRTAILPHYVELAPAVIESILRQAGLSEF